MFKWLLTWGKHFMCLALWRTKGPKVIAGCQWHYSTLSPFLMVCHCLFVTRKWQHSCIILAFLQHGHKPQLPLRHAALYLWWGEFQASTIPCKSIHQHWTCMAYIAIMSLKLWRKNISLVIMSQDFVNLRFTVNTAECPSNLYRSKDWKCNFKYI